MRYEVYLWVNVWMCKRCFYYGVVKSSSNKRPSRLIFHIEIVWSVDVSVLPLISSVSRFLWLVVQIIDMNIQCGFKHFAFNCISLSIYLSVQVHFHMALNKLRLYFHVTRFNRPNDRPTPIYQSAGLTTIFIPYTAHISLKIKL